MYQLQYDVDFIYLAAIAANMFLLDAIASFAAKVKSNLKRFSSKEIIASTHSLILVSTQVLKMFN